MLGIAEYAVWAFVIAVAGSDGQRPAAAALRSAPAAASSGAPPAAQFPKTGGRPPLARSDPYSHNRQQRLRSDTVEKAGSDDR